MSNVDVVCTDKTGTLTTGRLTLAEVVPVGDADAGDGRGGPGLDGPQRRRAEPDQRGAGRPLPGEPVAGAGRGAVHLGAAVERACRPTTRPGCWARRRRCAPRCAGRPRRRRCAAGTAQGLRVLVFARAADPGVPLRGAGRRARRCPRSSRWPWWRWPTSCAPTCRRPSPGSRRRASRSRCSPATTRTPSAALAARAGPAGHRARARRQRCTSSPTPELDAVVAGGVGLRPGGARSRRNGSSSRCAGRAATWPWSATA